MECKKCKKMGQHHRSKPYIHEKGSTGNNKIYSTSSWLSTEKSGYSCNHGNMFWKVIHDSITWDIGSYWLQAQNYTSCSQNNDDKIGPIIKHMAYEYITQNIEDWLFLKLANEIELCYKLA